MPAIDWQLPLAALAACLFLFLIVWLVPKYQMSGLRRKKIDVYQSKHTPHERLDLEAKLRTTVAQILGGMLVLFGGIVALGSLLATLKGQDIALQQVDATLKGQEIARQQVAAMLRGQDLARRDQELARRYLELGFQGAIAERLTRAVALLAPTESIESRIGGILALERIARSSPDDHWQVIQVLASYVKSHAPLPPQPDHTAAGTRPEMLPKDDGIGSFQVSQYGAKYPAIRPAADVQAALTAIALRRWPERDQGRIDLRQTDLRGADLRRADLTYALLAQADLTGAQLHGADLRRADLGAANLRYAILKGALVREANLDHARMQGCVPPEDLKGAYLRNTHLENVRLPKDMSGANVQRGLFLLGAKAVGTDFSFAKFEDVVAWPSYDQTTKFVCAEWWDFKGKIDKDAPNFKCMKAPGAQTGPSIVDTVVRTPTELAECKTFCAREYEAWKKESDRQSKKFKPLRSWATWDEAFDYPW